MVIFLVKGRCVFCKEVFTVFTLYSQMKLTILASFVRSLFVFGGTILDESCLSPL